MMALIAVLVVSAIGSVYAVTNFFTQNAPSSSGFGMQANCRNLQSTVTTVETNTTGDTTMQCPSSTYGFAAKGVTGTPTFTLPSGYTDLYVYPFANSLAATCAATTGSILLTSGSGVVFPATKTTYVYCADYSDPPIDGLAAFSISWSGP